MSASIHTALGERLRRLLEAGAREASRRGEPILVSATAAIPPMDPLRVFLRARTQERVFWEQPSGGFSLVAVGATARLTGFQEDRFQDVSAAWRRLRSRAVADVADGFPLSPPVCLGGFAFDPLRPPDPYWEGYSNARLAVSRILFLSHGGASWACLSSMAAPDVDASAVAEAAVAELRYFLCNGPADEPVRPAGDLTLEEETAPTAWRDTVARIVASIGRGALEKAVLARRVHLYSTAMLHPGPVLERLRGSYGSCTVFAFAQGDRCFLGATPERLARLHGQSVRTDCLAGSIARGATPAEDRSLGETLLADTKERHEHALVVEAAHKALAPLCAHLSVPDRPALLRMPNVQHLHTPLVGTLRAGAHILELVERLHPTPACGGLPREAAIAVIRACEPFDRGWYAGPVGWIDGEGGGEFVVAIRSALLRGSEALLYAGCGIVSGSDPDREYQESCLKLRPMLWALNGKQP